MKIALCTPKAALFPEEPAAITYLTDLSQFARASFALHDRALCEEDLSLLQPLPYVTVISPTTGKIFAYCRGEGGGESKLFGNVSVGLGGHIETEPVGLADVYDVITDNVCTELNEEVGLEIDGVMATMVNQMLVEGQFQIFYDPTNKVGRHHLCLTLHIHLDADQFGAPEHGIIEKGDWFTLEELLDGHANGQFVLENWSLEVLNQMVSRRDAAKSMLLEKAT